MISPASLPSPTWIWLGSELPARRDGRALQLGRRIHPGGLSPCISTPRGSFCRPCPPTSSSCAPAATPSPHLLPLLEVRRRGCGHAGDLICHVVVIRRLPLETRCDHRHCDHARAARGLSLTVRVLGLLPSRRVVDQCRQRPRYNSYSSRR